MTRFLWTETDRAKLVPGATVTAYGREYTIVRLDVPGWVHVDGMDYAVRLEECDPASIRPPRQLELSLGGEST